MCALRVNLGHEYYIDDESKRDQVYISSKSVFSTAIVLYVISNGIQTINLYDDIPRFLWLSYALHSFMDNDVVSRVLKDFTNNVKTHKMKLLDNLLNFSNVWSNSRRLNKPDSSSVRIRSKIKLSVMLM